MRRSTRFCATGALAANRSRHARCRITSPRSTPWRPIPCWSWSRRATRACAPSCCAPSPSRRIKALAPEIETLTHALIDAFPEDDFDLLDAFCRPDPRHRHRTAFLGVPETMAPRTCCAGRTRMVMMYQAGRSRAQEEDGRRRHDRVRGLHARLYRPPPVRAARPTLISALIAAEEAGRQAVHRRDDHHLHPAPERRPRGDGAHAGQRGKTGARDRHAARCGRGPPFVEEVAALRPAAASVSPAGPTRMWRFTATGSGVATRWGSCCIGRARRGRLMRRPSVSSPTGPTGPRTSPSGRGFISASARRSPGWRCRSRCRGCSRAARSLSLTEAPRYADIYHFHGLEALPVRAGRS